MKLASSRLSCAIFILSAFVSAFIVACASVPKPKSSPEDEAALAFKSRGETYLEMCESSCVLPGLFGDEEKFARQAKTATFAKLGANADQDAVSSFAASNDFANRYNRTMFQLAHPPSQLAK